MSLILEALRKSEAERRRGGAPDLLQSEPGASPGRGTARPDWWIAWTAGIAVVVAMLGLAWSLVRVAVPTPEPAPLPPSVVATPVPALGPERLPSVPRLTPAPIDIPTAVPAPVIQAPVIQAPAVASDLPIPLSALTPGERRALPPLQLSMHLWNEDPRRRFAILDGTRVAEGDRIGAVVVAAITRDGVVLDWNGRKLALPLP